MMFCHVHAAAEEIEIEDGSSVEGSHVEYVVLNLDNTSTTNQFVYKKHGANGNFYTAKGDCRFSKITSAGQIVWEATKNEFPNRVYYDPSQQKPLLQLIYSDEEFKLPQTQQRAQPAKVSQVAQVKKDPQGKAYVQIPMPKSGDDRGSVRSVASRPFAPTAKIAVPVAASHQYAEFKMPKTDNEDKGFVERKMPKTDDEGSTVQKPKIKATAVAATRASAIAASTKTTHAYVQMPLPKSGDEKSTVKPNRVTADIGAPVVSQDLGYVQMPMPKTDNEGDNVSTLGVSKKHIVKVETVHTPVKVAKPVAAASVVAHSQPIRSGVEDGQSFLEFGIPRTDNEGAGPVEGHDFLEFKLMSSGPEHGKAEAVAQATLPKRKAIVNAKYQDHAMPASTEAESDLDIENDPEIQFMLKLIEDLKQKIAALRQTLAEMDARDALNPQAQGL
ncbi:uncharacterized protein TOT_020000321 [Theileria orientalis strain Shintoku]|uniref:Uncharacterized protein n=1 Tax=Theileria orientalis strain Shintoku TaxID=869250 RepID=J4DP42_THEOR|nr:uncharacterized protein TOT_020000321 [Theileria orientalis strain Shintoku]BAM40054.1 uncharacterized protein TOT_020000321 [Theileria orientalis strain Shintoku]|eukprot:XP_009690355.1 uncharacterized protein TOT_020000321 [Theileria orientalis strain Shintoku]